MEGSIAVFMTAFGVMYFIGNKSESKKPLIFKAMATFMAVLLAIFYAIQTETPQGWWTVAGILCYMAADVLLEIRFLMGGVSFAVGHVCLMIGIMQAYSWNWETIWWFFLLYAGMCLVLRSYLTCLKKLLIPVLIYGVLLCCMASLAILAAGQMGGTAGLIAGAGGVCFVISDTILGWNHLSGKRKRSYSAVLLILYYMAVFFLALSLH